jgi:hypothetical protein
MLKLTGRVRNCSNEETAYTRLIILLNSMAKSEGESMSDKNYHETHVWKHWPVSYWSISTTSRFGNLMEDKAGRLVDNTVYCALFRFFFFRENENVTDVVEIV